MKKCINKVVMTLRTSRLTSFAHLPDLECLKYGPKGPKRCPNLAENSSLAPQIGPEGPCLCWRGCNKVNIYPFIQASNITQQEK